LTGTEASKQALFANVFTIAFHAKLTDVHAVAQNAVKHVD